MDKLRSLGVKAKESVHEVNEMFDCNGELASTDSRLRLRTRYELKDGWESGLLTIKQPQPASSDGLKREFELETELAADELSRLRSNLKTINYRLVSSYERVRHVLSGPFRDVEVVVDNLPDIGRFLEIEGEEDAVREAAELLGLSMNAALQDAYDTLHYNWCLSQGKSEVYFVEFSATEREFILAAERILFIPDSV